MRKRIQDVRFLCRKIDEFPDRVIRVWTASLVRVRDIARCSAGPAATSCILPPRIHRVRSWSLHGTERTYKYGSTRLNTWKLGGTIVTGLRTCAYTFDLHCAVQVHATSTKSLISRMCTKLTLPGILRMREADMRSFANGSAGSAPDGDFRSNSLQIPQPRDIFTDSYLRPWRISDMRNM
jgi:hypothetical protein